MFNSLVVALFASVGLYLGARGSSVSSSILVGYSLAVAAVTALLAGLVVLLTDTTEFWLGSIFCGAVSYLMGGALGIAFFAVKNRDRYRHPKK